MPSSTLTLYADWATDGLLYTAIDDDQAYEVSGENLIDLELEAVSIPKRHESKLVKAIAASGFVDFEDLLEIRLPSSIEIIGNNAFYGCDQLTTISLPETLTAIGQRALFLCPSLTTINISEDNQYYTVYEGVLFNKDRTVLIRYPSGSTATNYTIDANVTEIGSYAFSGCYYLENVVIGSNVHTIGEWAFYWSVNLDNMIIPNNVTSVGIYAFSDCYGLRSVTIGTGIDTISPYMFNWCNHLNNVTIPANITTIGYAAFQDCHYLINVYIERPYSMGNTIFGASFMFNNCHSSLSIYMPDSETVNFYKTEATNGWVTYSTRIYLRPVA
jgi:hypothetical protein